MKEAVVGGIIEIVDKGGLRIGALIVEGLKTLESKEIGKGEKDKPVGEITGTGLTGAIAGVDAGGVSGGINVVTLSPAGVTAGTIKGATTGETGVIKGEGII